MPTGNLIIAAFNNSGLYGNNGNATTNVIIETSNVTGNFTVLPTNNSGLYNVNPSNVVIGNSFYSNANVANFLPTYSGNISSANIGLSGIFTDNYYYADGSPVSFQGNYSNTNVASYLQVLTSNVSTTGNVTANFFIGDGSYLTNINAGNVIGAYSNANVADFLPIYSGNLLAGNALITGNLQGNYVLGNGAFLTGITSNYSNTNVASYLQVLTSNVSTTANVSASNVNIGNIGSLNWIPGLANSQVIQLVPNTNSVMTSFRMADPNSPDQGIVDLTANGYTWTFRPNGNLELAGNAYTAKNITANILFNTANVIQLGNNAGNTNQATDSIVVGFGAGQFNQGTESVAIGLRAGLSAQGTTSIAIGRAAGGNNQSANSIAIGFVAGQFNQSGNAIAIGRNAGNIDQGPSAIAIGQGAGNNLQGNTSIAIGKFSGFTTQGGNALAIGEESAYSDQGANAIAIGRNAGYTTQGDTSIAIGSGAGQNIQSANSIAIGRSAGNNNQGTESIAIGHRAGNINQGDYAVAIGFNAGQFNQSNNSIVISAGNSNVTANNQGLYINPVRNDTGNTAEIVFFNTSTKELTYAAANSVTSNYGNSNVANYLPTFTGNLTAGNISATGNVTANNFNGNIFAGNIITVGRNFSNPAPAGIVAGNANIASILWDGSANWSVTRALIPSGDAAYNLGTTTQRWNNFYSITVNAQSGGFSNFVSATGNVIGGNVNSLNTISAVGNITGNFFIGNGSQLTGITANYGNANVANYLPVYGGNILSSNVETNSVVGNAAGALTLSANNSNIGDIHLNAGNIRIGKQNQSANIATRGTGDMNITTNEGNATEGNIILRNGANGNIELNPNGTGIVKISTGVSVTGNATVGNLILVGNLFDSVGALSITTTSNGNIDLSPNGTGIVIINSSLSATGNVSGNFFIGNGSQLTGITSSYGNSNVAAYLPTYTGNIGNTGNSVSVQFVNYKDVVQTGGNATGTITPNPGNGGIINYTLTGNITLNAFGGTPQAGQSMVIVLTQDGTGNRLLTSTMKWSGGFKTLSTAANAIDIATVWFDGSTYYGALTRGYA